MSLLFLITSLGQAELAISNGNILQITCPVGFLSQMLVVKSQAAMGIMFLYAFIPQCIHYSKNPILFERDIANLV